MTIQIKKPKSEAAQGDSFNLETNAHIPLRFAEGLSEQAVVKLKRIQVLTFENLIASTKEFLYTAIQNKKLRAEIMRFRSNIQSLTHRIIDRDFYEKTKNVRKKTKIKIFLLKIFNKLFIDIEEVFYFFFPFPTSQRERIEYHYARKLIL